jgi:hypothetical protein
MNSIRFLNLACRWTLLGALGILLVLLEWSTPASGQPTVDYTATGNPDNWTLDFSVQNPPNSDVEVSSLTIDINFPILITDTGIPPGGWYTEGPAEWTGGLVAPGQTVSGFEILDPYDTTPPSSIPWAIYSTDYVITGTAYVVPEPSTIILFGLGSVMLGGITRKQWLGQTMKTPE